MQEVLVNRLFKLALEKVWIGERPAMTLAVDLGRKATIQTNPISSAFGCRVGDDNK